MGSTSSNPHSFAEIDSHEMVSTMIGFSLQCERFFQILVIALLMSAVASAEFAAGAAKVDVTPELGVSLDGPISKNGPVKSIHDRLHARALVLDDGDNRVALVVVDNCMTSRDVFDAAKESIHQATGLAIDHMLMAATHTHAAPRTGHIGRDRIDEEYHRFVSEGISRSRTSGDRKLTSRTYRLCVIRSARLDRVSAISL